MQIKIIEVVTHRAENIYFFTVHLRIKIRIIKIQVDHGPGLREKCINYCLYYVLKLIPNLHEL